MFAFSLLLATDSRAAIYARPNYMLTCGDNVYPASWNVLHAKDYPYAENSHYIRFKWNDNNAKGDCKDNECIIITSDGKHKPYDHNEEKIIKQCQVQLGSISPSKDRDCIVLHKYSHWMYAHKEGSTAEHWELQYSHWQPKPRHVDDNHRCAMLTKDQKWTFCKETMPLEEQCGTQDSCLVIYPDRSWQYVNGVPEVKGYNCLTDFPATNECDVTKTHCYGVCEATCPIGFTKTNYYSNFFSYEPGRDWVCWKCPEGYGFIDAGDRWWENLINPTCMAYDRFWDWEWEWMKSQPASYHFTKYEGDSCQQNSGEVVKVDNMYKLKDKCCNDLLNTVLQRREPCGEWKCWNYLDDTYEKATDCT